MGEESRLTVVRVDDLEVLDGGLGDAAVEVQHVGLRLLVPARALVPQGDQPLRVAVGQQSLRLLGSRNIPVAPLFPSSEDQVLPPYALGADGDPPVVLQHAGDDHGHLARTLESQHIGLLEQTGSGRSSLRELRPGGRRVEVQFELT